MAGSLAILGWSTRQWLTFAIVSLVVFVLGPLLGSRLGFPASETVLWLTVLVILFYTIETQGLRLEMVRQNEMAIQPFVIASIEAGEVGEILGPRFEAQMVFRNIGRGTALFVQVREITLTDVAGDRVQFVARFKGIDYLEPGGYRVGVADCVPIDPRIAPQHLDFVPSLNPRYAIEDYDFMVDYQDISGQAWETVMQMGRGGIRLLRHGKVKP